MMLCVFNNLFFTCDLEQLSGKQCIPFNNELEILESADTLVSKNKIPFLLIIYLSVARKS